MTWHPSASIDTLKKRALLIQQVRQFFAQSDVLEVETPLLSANGTPDLHIQSIQTDSGYLHTSPEYAMKRLLAAGSGPIFQICKVFRAHEKGTRHNPEFSMLEWYQPGWSDQQLIAQVIGLLHHLGLENPVKHYSYRELFKHVTGMDPLTESEQTLRTLATDISKINCSKMDRNELLDLLMSLHIEPAMNPNEITVVTRFPASQAALAIKEPDTDGTEIARRFEVYCGGLELANGYQELTDANEQQARFEQENRLRKESGLDIVPIDTHLISAMKAGLPDCAGVALGLDRVIMLLLGLSSISQSISFDAERA